MEDLGFIGRRECRVVLDAVQDSDGAKLDVRERGSNAYQKDRSTTGLLLRLRHGLDADSNPFTNTNLDRCTTVDAT